MIGSLSTAKNDQDPNLEALKKINFGRLKFFFFKQNVNQTSIITSMLAIW